MVKSFDKADVLFHQTECNIYEHQFTTSVWLGFLGLSTRLEDFIKLIMSVTSVLTVCVIVIFGWLRIMCTF